MKTLFHYGLALMMLVTGSINTLTTRGADLYAVRNRYGEYVEFTHPFVQAACMFIGEALCFLVFHIELCWARRRERNGGKKVEPATKFNKFLLALPAACDMCATSVMYIGLGLTYASDFQMLRGCVVIFTGFASCIFLRRKLRLPHWTGMVLVTGGTVAVGTASLVCTASDDNAKNPVLGNILIILAQIIVAAQMVIEEKLIAGHRIPALQVVGLEGCFGFCFIVILIIILYFIPQPTVFKPLYPLHSAPWYNATTDHGLSACPHGGNNRTVSGKVEAWCYSQGNHFEDAWDAFVMLGRSGSLIGYTLGTVFSIAFFNFSGVSITKHLNAATRMVLDSLRTIVIWAFSLGVGWQSFCYMDVIGFVILLIGTVIFNEIVPLPWYKKPEEKAVVHGIDQERLLDFVEGASSVEASPALPVMDQLLTPSMSKNTAVHKR